MLHSANLGPKLLTGNELTMRQAQPIGVANSDVSSMLWLNTQTELSSSLIVTSLIIQPGVSGDSAVARNYYGFSRRLNGRMEDLRSGMARVNPLVFNDTGELVNETKIVTRYGKGSAGFSIEGHNPEKDGIPSCRIAAEAFTTGGASLSGQAAPLQLWKLAFTASQN